MRAASTALQAMLASGQPLLMADCYTITLLGGQVLRYTDYDLDLSIGGNVYTSSGVKFKRGKLRWVVGLEVDTLDLSIYAGPLDLINGVGFMQQVKGGILDGATIRLDRAYMAIGSTQAESLQLFYGRVAGVQTGRTEIKVTVKSFLELLNIKMPRNLYQAGCANTLFDSMCGLTKTAYAVAGTVSTNGTVTQFASGLANVAGWFDLGVVTFGSGANNGISRTVRAYSGGGFSFSQPWPSAPQAGDAFTAWPGCDKLLATCVAKYNNKSKFRGEPFIPVPETAY